MQLPSIHLPSIQRNGLSTLHPRSRHSTHTPAFKASIDPNLVNSVVSGI